MFWKQRRRVLSIYMAMPGSNDGVLLHEKEIQMAGPYELRLKYDATDDGKRFNGGENYWADLDNTDLAGMLGFTNQALDLARRRENEGGKFKLVLSGAIVGGTPPPALADALKEMTFDKLTQHGYTTIENRLTDLGKELLKRGRFKATKKEGKPQKAEDDTPAADW